VPTANEQGGEIPAIAPISLIGTQAPAHFVINELYPSISISGLDTSVSKHCVLIFSSAAQNARGQEISQ